MNKEFIPYKQALELKELGFDEHCFGAYNMQKEFDYCNHDEGWDNASLEILREGTTSTVDVLAPLYQQAFRWFREKYEYYTELFVGDDKKFGFMITNFVIDGRVDSPISRGYLTYEEAELACLKKLIEIAKTNNMTQQTTHIGDTNKMVTAVEWLFNELDYILELYPSRSEKVKMFFKQAKAMEIERRKEDFKIAYNQGYLDAQCNHINDADNASNEYNYLNQSE